MNTDTAHVAVRAVHKLAQYLKHGLRYAPRRKQIVHAIDFTHRPWKFLGDHIDLRHLAHKITQKVHHSGTQKAAGDLIDKLDKCIYKSRSQRAAKEIGGLSIWFPGKKSAFLEQRKHYSRLRFNKISKEGWMRFIETFHGLTQ